MRQPMRLHLVGGAGLVRGSCNADHNDFVLAREENGSTIISVDVDGAAGRDGNLIV